jgi:hypothetical protein
LRAATVGYLNRRHAPQDNPRFKCSSVRELGEHFKPGAMRPSSQCPSPVRFAFPETDAMPSSASPHLKRRSALRVKHGHRVRSAAFASLHIASRRFPGMEETFRCKGGVAPGLTYSPSSSSQKSRQTNLSRSGRIGLSQEDWRAGFGMSLKIDSPRPALNVLQTCDKHADHIPKWPESGRQSDSASGNRPAQLSRRSVAVFCGEVA